MIFFSLTKIFIRNNNNQSNSNANQPKSTYQRPAGMQNLFGQVDEVKTTMEQNMKEIMERGEKLNQLEDTSREMMSGAQNMSKNVRGKK